MGSILSRRGPGGNRRADVTSFALSFVEGLTTGFYDCDLLVRQVVEVVDEMVKRLFRFAPSGTVPLVHANQCIRRYIPTASEISCPES